MNAPSPNQATVELNERDRNKVQLELQKSINTLFELSIEIYGLGSPDYNALQKVISQASEADTQYFDARTAYQRRFVSTTYDPNKDTPESDRKIIEALNTAVRNMQDQNILIQAKIEFLRTNQAEEQSKQAATAANPNASPPSNTAASASATSLPLSPGLPITTLPIANEPSSPASPDKNAQTTAPPAKQPSAWSTFTNFVKSIFSVNTLLNLATGFMSTLRAPNESSLGAITPPTQSKTPSPNHNSYGMIATDLSIKSSGETKAASSKSTGDLVITERDLLLQKIHEFNAKVDDFVTQRERPFSASIASLTAITNDIQARFSSHSKSDEFDSSFIDEAVTEAKKLAHSSDSEMEKLRDEQKRLANEVEQYRESEGKNDIALSKALDNATQKLNNSANTVNTMKRLLESHEVKLDSNPSEPSPPSFHG